MLVTSSSLPGRYVYVVVGTPDCGVVAPAGTSCWMLAVRSWLSSQVAVRPPVGGVTIEPLPKFAVLVCSATAPRPYIVDTVARSSASYCVSVNDGIAEVAGLSSRSGLSAGAVEFHIGAEVALASPRSSYWMT